MNGTKGKAYARRTNEVYAFGLFLTSLFMLFHLRQPQVKGDGEC